MRSVRVDRILRVAERNQDGKITSEELFNAMETSGNEQDWTAAEIFQ